MKNNLNIKEEFNEYEIPFEVARTMNIYDCYWSKPFEEIKEIIEEYYKTKKEDLLNSLPDLLCSITFGSLDIEFQYYGLENDGGMDIGFFVCKQNEITIYRNGRNNKDEDGWDSYEFADLAFTLDLLKDKTELEKLMFEAMLKLAKKDKLHWKKKNKLNEKGEIRNGIF